MKITIESTSRVVTLSDGKGEVPARIWEGETPGGVKVICFVTRIAVKEGQDMAQFKRDLAEQRTPSAEAESFPLRLII